LVFKKESAISILVSRANSFKLLQVCHVFACAFNYHNFNAWTFLALEDHDEEYDDDLVQLDFLQETGEEAVFGLLVSLLGAHS